MGKRRQSLKGRGIGENISAVFLELGLEREEGKVSSEENKCMPSMKERKVGTETKKPKEKKETPKAETKIAESASGEKKAVSKKEEASAKAKKAEPVSRKKPERAKIEERKTSSQTEETKSGLEKEEVASEKKNPAIAKVEKPASEEKPVKTGKAETDYESEIIKEPKPRPDQTDFEDKLFEYARDAVISSGQASASMLQRRLRIDYSQAVRLIDMLRERRMLPEQN